MVYSTRRFVVCLSVCHFVLFCPFSIAITSLGEERANLSAFRTFVRFVLVWICLFPLPLGVWEGLRFVTVALPGLFSYLFLQEEDKPLDVKVYIINTDTSDKPGEHWVAIYFRNNDEAIYFDSYGLPPLEDYILQFIQRNTRHWIYHKELLQSPWSRVCGMYCINILDQLGRGLDLKTAIHEQLYNTGEDPYQNDRDVEMWFSLNYGQLY